MLNSALSHNILDFSARVLAQVHEHVPRVDIEGRMHTLIAAWCLVELVDWPQFAQRRAQPGQRQPVKSTQFAMTTGVSHLQEVGAQGVTELRLKRDIKRHDYAWVLV